VNRALQSDLRSGDGTRRRREAAGCTEAVSSQPPVDSGVAPRLNDVIGPQLAARLLGSPLIEPSEIKNMGCPEPPLVNQSLMLPGEVPVRFRQIPGGTFWMGSRDGYHDEMPRQLIHIPTCFYSKSRITGRRRIQGYSPQNRLSPMPALAMMPAG
jgi:hypothetical protein